MRRLLTHGIYGVGGITLATLVSFQMVSVSEPAEVVSWPFEGPCMFLYKETYGEQAPLAELCKGAYEARTEDWLNFNEVLAWEGRKDPEFLPECIRCMRIRCENPIEETGRWHPDWYHPLPVYGECWSWDPSRGFPFIYTWKGDETAGVIYHHCSSFFALDGPSWMVANYHIVDDILVIAGSLPPFCRGTFNWDGGYGYIEYKAPVPFPGKAPGFSTPMSDSLTYFEIDLRTAGKPARGAAPALSRQVLAKPEPENRLRGVWLRAPKEPHYGSISRLEELFTSIYNAPYEDERFPVLHEGVALYKGPGPSPITRLAMRHFGHLYPLERWLVSEDTIHVCPTWKGTFQQGWLYKAKRTTKYGGEIDLFPLDCEGRPVRDLPSPGIYYVLGDFVFICYNDWPNSGLPKQERPRRFMSNGAKPYTVEVLRRIHKEDLELLGSQD